MTDRPVVEELELYLRDGLWHYSILERPLARACGRLNADPISEAFPTAELELIELVEQGYGTCPEAIAWDETQPEWWVAAVNASPGGDGAGDEEGRPTWREWHGKPWYPGRATSVVLYYDGDSWHTSVIPERGGFVCGRLAGQGLSPDEAKSAVLKRLAATDEVELAGEWQEDGAGWWSAELRFLPGPTTEGGP